MTSTSMYKEILPTYLYIKQHSITKKKYFGKTTKSDPEKYNGSGVYWLKHISKHGIENVKTIWISDLYYDTSIVEIALHFSIENNIVESSDWANLKLENGLDGGLISDETKAKISAKLKGRKLSPEWIAKITNLTTGRKRSDETKAKILDQDYLSL